MGRDIYDSLEGEELEISIHSPRMGRDEIVFFDAADVIYFNPLSPHGERRHSLNIQGLRLYFNPLSPHGERPLRSLLSTVIYYHISIHSPRMGRDGHF